MSEANKISGSMIIISGPSGVGKSSIMKNILSDKNLKFFESISYTTRNPRKGEENGVHYNFVTKEKFQEMINNNEFLEFKTVHENSYGTPLKILDKLKEGSNIILDIDYQGVLEISKNIAIINKAINAGINLIKIFILPPSLEILEERLKKRNDMDNITQEKRIKCALEEIKYSVHYDFILTNDDLDKTTKLVKCCIENLNNEDLLIYKVKNNDKFNQILIDSINQVFEKTIDLSKLSINK
jgi:guanylate kinase